MKHALLFFALFFAAHNLESAEYVKDGQAMAFVVRAEMIEGKWSFVSGDEKYKNIKSLTSDMDKSYMSGKTGPGFYLYVKGTNTIQDIEKLGIGIRTGLAQHLEYSLLTAFVDVNGKNKDITDQLEKVNY